jgi:hypothetical protein
MKTFKPKIDYTYNWSNSKKIPVTTSFDKRMGYIYVDVFLFFKLLASKSINERVKY